MSAERFAALLIQARISGRRIGALPPELEPSDEAAAYRLQDMVVDKLGVKVAGWKVGAPSRTAPPSCAPLFAGHVVKSPAHILASRDGENGVEAELAFRLGRDLPTRGRPYSAEDVWDAVDTLHPAIEYLDSRFADRRAASVLAQLADNLTNGGFCWGPPLADWRGLDLAKAEATLLLAGQQAAHAVGGNAAGHPRRLIAWLANHCAERGRPLRAGDFVTTGSHTGLVTAPLRAAVVARFAEIGESQLTLVA
jgi:2-keto-4-pentenoate hydratase